MAKWAVAYTVSGSDVRRLAVSLTSLLDQYHGQQDLDVVIMAADLTAADITALRALPTQLGRTQVAVFVWTLPPAMAQVAPAVAAGYPAGALWRYFFPGQFDNYEQILFLAPTVLVNASVDRLFERSTPAQAVAAGLAQPAWLAGQARLDADVLLYRTGPFNTQWPQPKLIAQLNQHPGWHTAAAVLNGLFSEVGRLPLAANFQLSDAQLVKLAEGQQAGPAVARLLAARQHVVLRNFTAAQPGDQPWRHLAVADDFEGQYWQYLAIAEQRQALPLHVTGRL